MGRRLPVNCRGVSERCPPTRTGLRYSFTRSWSLGDANLGREVGSANSATPPDPRNCDGRRHLPDHVLWNSAPSLPSLEGPDSQILQAPTKVSSPLFSPWGPHPPPAPRPPPATLANRGLGLAAKSQNLPYPDPPRTRTWYTPPASAPRLRGVHVVDPVSPGSLALFKHIARFCQL